MLIHTNIGGGGGDHFVLLLLLFRFISFFFCLNNFDNIFSSFFMAHENDCWLHNWYLMYEFVIFLFSRFDRALILDHNHHSHLTDWPHTHWAALFTKRSIKFVLIMNFCIHTYLSWWRREENEKKTFLQATKHWS